MPARYRSGGDGLQVGGDFYDVFPVTSHVWDVTVGDVRGKGPDAAAVTGLARYTLRAAAVENASPARVLAVLNRVLLAETDPQLLVTAAYARLDVGRPGVLAMVASVVPRPELSDTRVELLTGDTLARSRRRPGRARRTGPLTPWSADAMI